MPPESPISEAEVLAQPSGIDAPDPELFSLPDPPKGGRVFVMCVLFLAGLAPLVMALALRNDAKYAFSEATPLNFGDLRGVDTSSFRENQWICAEGFLGAARGLRYERPFAGESYRVSPVVGDSDVWVEVSIPPGEENDRFVPPHSFCGRIVSFEHAGLRYRGLREAISSSSHQPIPPGAWLVISGDTPARARGALALMVFFSMVGAWNLWAVYRLFRRRV